MPVYDAEVPRRRENQVYKVLLRTPRLCVLCVFPEHFKVGKLTLSLGKYGEGTQRNHNLYSRDSAKRGLSVSTKLRYHHQWRYRGSRRTTRKTCQIRLVSRTQADGMDYALSLPGFISGARFP